MGVLISVGLPLVLAFIMFSVGLGLTVFDFKRVLLRPKPFFVGAVSQLVLVPVVAFICILLFGIEKELAVGMMILALCPGGVTSNIMSKIARGDVALSVSLTAVVSLLTMLTVPFILTWSINHFMGMVAPPVSITSLAISMFLITTLPVLTGIILRHFATDFALKADPVVTKIATVLFFIVVGGALASNWSLFVENIIHLAPALVTLNVTLVVLGALLARIAGLSLHSIKTVAIETGIQNSTVGITLVAIIAGPTIQGFSAYALPSAGYGITMYFVTLPAILWFRRSITSGDTP